MISGKLSEKIFLCFYKIGMYFRVFHFLHTEIVSDAILNFLFTFGDVS